MDTAWSTLPQLPHEIWTSIVRRLPSADVQSVARVAFFNQVATETLYEQLNLYDMQPDRLLALLRSFSTRQTHRYVQSVICESSAWIQTQHAATSDDNNLIRKAAEFVGTNRPRWGGTDSSIRMYATEAPFMQDDLTLRDALVAMVIRSEVTTPYVAMILFIVARTVRFVRIYEYARRPYFLHAQGHEESDSFWNFTLTDLMRSSMIGHCIVGNPREAFVALQTLEIIHLDMTGNPRPSVTDTPVAVCLAPRMRRLQLRNLDCAKTHLCVELLRNVPVMNLECLVVQGSGPLPLLWDQFAVHEGIGSMRRPNPRRALSLWKLNTLSISLSCYPEVGRDYNQLLDDLLGLCPSMQHLQLLVHGGGDAPEPPVDTRRLGGLMRLRSLCINQRLCPGEDPAEKIDHTVRWLPSCTRHFAIMGLTHSNLGDLMNTPAELIRQALDMDGNGPVASITFSMLVSVEEGAVDSFRNSFLTRQHEYAIRLLAVGTAWGAVAGDAIKIKGEARLRHAYPLPETAYITMEEHGIDRSDWLDDCDEFTEFEKLLLF